MFFTSIFTYQFINLRVWFFSDKNKTQKWKFKCKNHAINKCKNINIKKKKKRNQKKKTRQTWKGSQMNLKIKTKKTQNKISAGGAAPYLMVLLLCIPKDIREYTAPSECFCSICTLSINSIFKWNNIYLHVKKEIWKTNTKIKYKNINLLWRK